MTERDILRTAGFLRIQTRPSAAHRLSDGAPDVLDEAVALGQTVERIVALAHGPDKSAEGVDVVLALDGTAVLVNLRNRDLDRGVVLGLDDAVRGAALAWDVTAKREESVRVLPPCRTLAERGPYRSTISPLSFSIVAAVVWCCWKRDGWFAWEGEAIPQVWLVDWKCAGVLRIWNFGGSGCRATGSCREVGREVT